MFPQVMTPVTNADVCAGADMNAYVNIVSADLIFILNKPNTPKTLLENTGNATAAVPRYALLIYVRTCFISL